MVTNRLLLWDLRRAFSLYGYFLTRGIRAHRHLTHQCVWFVGTENIFAFEQAAEAAWKDRLAEQKHSPALIHLLGGSTYGAHASVREMHRWVLGLIQTLGIRHAIIALHFGRDGRVDFHVLAANTDISGRSLYCAELKDRARTAARALTDQFNERRLRLGEMPMGNLTATGETVFPDPRRELTSPTLVAEPATSPSTRAAASREIGPDGRPSSPPTKPYPAKTSAAPSLSPRIEWELLTRQLHEASRGDEDEDELRKRWAAFLRLAEEASDQHPAAQEFQATLKALLDLALDADLHRTNTRNY